MTSNLGFEFDGIGKRLQQIVPTEGVPTFKFGDAEITVSFKNPTAEHRRVKATAQLGPKALGGFELMVGLGDTLTELFPDGAHFYLTTGVTGTALDIGRSQERILFSAASWWDKIALMGPAEHGATLTEQQMDRLMTEQTALMAAERVLSLVYRALEVN